MDARQPYPTAIGDGEWALVAPYLSLMTEAAPQRRYPLRAVFSGLRYIVKTGMQWRWLPHDLPPWPVVYQQPQRWLAAGRFDALVHDLRLLLREAAGRTSAPTAAVCDSHTQAGGPGRPGRDRLPGRGRRCGPGATRERRRRRRQPSP